MVKDFLKSSTYYFIAKIFNSAINLIVFAYAARRLNLTEMGYYALLSVSLLFLGFFMTLEIQSGFMRYYIEYKTKEQKQAFEHSIITLLIFANLAMGGLLLLFKPVIEKIFVPIENRLFLVLVVTPIATGLANLFLAKLKLENRYKKVTLLLILQGVVYGTSVALGIAFSANVVFTLFIAGLLQQFFLLALYFLHLKHFRFSVNYSLIKTSVKFSVILLPTVFSIHVSNLSAKVIAGKIISIASAGIYEILNKVSNIMLLVIDPIYQAFTPIIYSNYKDKDFQRSYYMILGLNMLALLLLVIFFSLFNTEIIGVIGGRKYLLYADYVAVFIFTAALQVTARLFEVNIYLSERGKYATIIEVLSAILMTTSAAYTGTHYGLKGIMLSILIVYLFRCTLYIYYSNKLFAQFFVKPYLIASYFLIVLCTLGLHYFYTNELHWSLKALLLPLEMTVVCLMFLKLFKISITQLIQISIKNTKQ